MASSWFDQSYYLSAKAAYNNAHAVGGLTTWTSSTVQASFNAAGMTAEQHYSQYGWGEGLSPNAYYVESQYVASKVTQLNANSVGGRTNWTAADFYSSLNGANPFYHYVQYGAYETGVEPSTGFSDDTYYSNKATYNNAHLVDGRSDWTAPEVKTSFQSAGLTPIGHYELYGQTEGFYNPIPTPTPGQTYTLTTAIDNIVGTSGNDTIIGTSAAANPTLNVGDSINGNGGADTFLWATDGTNGTITGSQFKNVQTITATNNGAVAGDTLTLTGVLGLTNVGVESSGNAMATTFGTLNNNVAFSAKNTLGGATLSLSDLALTGSADAMVMTLEGVGDRTVSPVVTFGTVTGLANEYETMTVHSNGTARNYFEVDTNATQTSLKTLTFDGAAAATMTFTAATNTLPTTLTKIDASANTGGVQVGNATTTLGATDQTVTGGSGNDTFYFGANLTSGDTVDGGAGTDKVQVTGAISSTTWASVKNVEAARFDMAAAVTQNVTDIGGISTFDVSGAFAMTLNNMVDKSSITLVGNTTTLNTGLKDNTGASDSLTLNMSTSTGAGRTLATLGNLVGLETINVSTVGTSANAITTDNMAAKHVVTGDQALTVGTLSAATVFDGSAMTGNLTLGGGTAYAVVGGSIQSGSGDDTITAGAGAQIINTGAGADTIIAGAGDDSISAGDGNDTITAGVGKDVVNGGSGTNTYNIASATDSLGTGLIAGATVDSTSIANATAYDTITANIGDSIVITSATAAAAGVNKGTTAAVEGGVYFSAAYGAAYWNDGTNTYIAADIGNDTNFDATDVFVTIAGVHNLTATATAGANWTFQIAS